MTGSLPSIRARDLVKAYAGRRVLDGVSLDVDAGEVVALLGPNGAGKTTAVEILEGYRAADSGDASVLGLDPWRAGRRWRARIGLMLQDGGVDPRLSAAEAIRLHSSFHAEPRGVDELLDVVGLRDVATTRYRQLSGGERQRLALALALVGRPEVLFLDEPTAGMDPAARASTRALVRALAHDGTAVLMTTHDLGDVERCADRVAILSRGRIVADGSPTDVAAGSGGSGGLRVRLTGADLEAGDGGLGRALSERWPDARVGRSRDGWLTLDGVPPEPPLVAAVAAWAASAGLLIVDLRIGASTLEERYLELTGDAEVGR